MAELRKWRRSRGDIGLVPTMGAFHEGHLVLMRHSVAESQATAVSLFVNPTQFGPTEDLAKYPRPFERDREMAESVGVDALFAPPVEEVYPRKTTTIRVAEVSELWEGERRPGHFEGVATVVLKLFHLFEPERAFFGLKDLQQCAVIRRMVEDLDVPIDLRFIETYRESSGLALSSRNAYLSEGKREEASQLHRSLRMCADRIREEPTRLAPHLQEAKEDLKRSGFETQYVAAVDPSSMLAVSQADRTTRLIVAAVFEGVRLIDNVPVFSSFDGITDKSHCIPKR